MIRNFIMRQMSMNRYGISQFVKNQVSEHQRKFLELQSLYKNTQSIDQQMEIMKSIINILHLIDQQDNVSLETIDSYQTFINDYKTCKRKCVNINIETTQLYKYVYQRFMDQTVFDQIIENSLFSKSLVDIKYLQLNSLIYQFSEQYESEPITNIVQIHKKILAIANELGLQTTGIIQLKVQILAYRQVGFFHQTICRFEDAEDPLKRGLELIQSLKQYQDSHSITIKPSDKEWLFQIEKDFLKTLSKMYYELGQTASCIEYQDKTLQLIKDYEGISYDYYFTLQNFSNTYISFDLRQLKIIEETCQNLQKNEVYLLFQIQRLKVLYCLDQLNIKEYDKIIKLHQEVQIIDDNFQTAVIIQIFNYNFKFYSTIIICAIRLKCYSDINKWIDLMFSYSSIITDNQLDMVVSQGQILHQEFLDDQFDHNKNVYEQTILYYQEKTNPFFQDIQKQFTDNYFNFKASRQREIEEQMLKILRGYSICSLLCNDDREIRSKLEYTYKLFLNNDKYGECILQIFRQLYETQTLPPKVKTQLREYIQQLRFYKYQ